MQEINIQYFKTAYGELILGSYDDELVMADWRYRKMRDSIDSRLQTKLNAGYNEINNEVLDNTRQQLNEYFEYKRRTFDLPIRFVGTDFQKNVWKGLMKIPYGKTCSYLDLATSISKIKAVRAVANANGANAISIIVPCHRIIGNNGALVGYAGGVPTKKKLLDLENSLFTP
ncbi:MAG: cysteine methyltransferase [endosymbiont of Galathealinum brachiosum]|uniref:Methylated-DNA--protein-cysteine methyltransferase n=1 Tax=endosymbiont of Galathealinum brachiosum TaxID=2200906 RepID=A0A370DJB5_9GAMM|nr:MAG: cysteine methyltransferase [endosymbiont of Galathealinum brachiosum]